jgi:hypothetical protein
MGWSTEGAKFYQNVSKIICQREKFGYIAYSWAKMPSLTDNSKSSTNDNQDRCLPANTLNQTNHGNKGCCCAAVMMMRLKTLVHTRSQGDQAVPWLSRNSTASLSQGSSSDLSYKDDKIEEPPDNNYKEDSLVGV